MCPSTDRPLMVFPSQKCGSVQLVVCIDDGTVSIKYVFLLNEINAVIV